MFDLNEINDDRIRFGDVLTNLTSFIPRIYNLHKSNENYKISIEMEQFNYFVSLTPCCSYSKESTLGNDALTITPLRKILPKFLENSYFKEDLTRINRKLTAQQSMPEKGWIQLSIEERTSRMNNGLQYAFSNYFIYDGKTYLLPYEILDKSENPKGNPINLSYYMIDFKHTHSIIMSKEEQLKSKKYQLSIDARSELRNKIAFFYGNTPNEDIID